MTAARHDNEIYIRATPAAVWQAITDPAFTRRYFLGSDVASSWGVGDGWRMVDPSSGADLIEGVVDEIVPSERLVTTFRVVDDPELAAEPPSRVEWVVTPAGGVTRLTVRHLGLARSPRTWEHVRLRWHVILDGMKTVLETGEPLGQVDDPELGAAAPAEDITGAWHRAQGIEANNSVWDILGREDRTADDDEEMLRRAYAAAYHWARAAGAGPANGARADWLLAKVWVALGHGDQALRYSDRVLAACAQHGLDDFDLAYAHEARARALACLGRLDEAAEERAAAAAVPIADPEDEAIVVADLAAGPWFGLDPA